MKLRIVYSHHCFTQAVDKAPDIDPNHSYTCTKRPNDRRVFCEARWKASRDLPGIVAAMRDCYFTRHHNYFVWQDPVGEDASEYFVYFTVVRRQGFVEMEIESAYPRTDGAQARQGARKVGLRTLILNAADGRTTHPPPA